jgi:hypothetical protein
MEVTMGFFKKLSKELTKKEIEMLKHDRRDLFHNLSMDRQGEIAVTLSRLTAGTC